MKHGKKLLSLLLALVMLCGLVQIPVSAVGTASPTQIEFVGAQTLVNGVTASGSGLYSNTGMWGNRALALYFTEPVSDFLNAKNSNWLVVVDDDNNIVEFNGQPLKWMGGDRSVNPWSIQYHTIAILKNTSVTRNGAIVDTWPALTALLAEEESLAGKGYRLQVRLFDSAGTDGDGVVNSIKGSTSGTYLQGDIKVDANGNINAGNIDCAVIDLGTVDKDANYITQTGTVTLNDAKMTDETNMTLSFSEAVTVDPSRTTAVLEVVKPSTTVVYTHPVTLNSDGTAALTDTTWTAIKAEIGENAGSTARLKLTEKNLDAGRFEYTLNLAVDTVWGTESHKPLRSAGTYATAGTLDYVYCPVSDSTGFAEIEDVIIVDKRASGSNTLYDIVMTFSKPVTIKNKGQVFFTYHEEPDNNNHSYFWQVSPTSVSYLNKQTINNVSYASVIKATFSLSSTQSERMPQSLVADERYRCGIRFCEYSAIVLDGLVSPSTVCDISGQGIKETYARASTDIAWGTAVEAVNPKIVSAVVQNASDTKVDILVTFSKPVTHVSTNNWDTIMRFGNYGNGGTKGTSNEQQPMSGKQYIDPVTIEGKPYSNQILYTFKANSQPLLNDVLIVFPEYNHHANQHGNDFAVTPNVIADVDGNGLLATTVTHCNNAGTGCSYAPISISHTKATLDEDAQAITSVSRVDDTHISVVFPMHVTSINTASAITLGSCQVTAVEGSAGAWTFTLDKAMTGSDVVLTIPAGAVTLGYNGQAVTKAMTASLPFTDQLQAGGTVTMTKDETVDELAIAEGVTLDLNGHPLTAGSVATITSTSAIIDSKNGEGGIAVAKDGLLFVGTNAQLPLYDNGVYRFFDCEMVHMQRAGQTADSVMFGVRMELNDRAYALLEDSVASGAELTLQLQSSAFDQPITYAFSADIVTEYAQNMQNNEGYWVIVLTVYGLDVLDEGTELTVTPLLHSSTSVTVTGEALTYTR